MQRNNVTRWVCVGYYGICIKYIYSFTFVDFGNSDLLIVLHLHLLIYLC